MYISSIYIYIYIYMGFGVSYPYKASNIERDPESRELPVPVSLWAVLKTSVS